MKKSTAAAACAAILFPSAALAQDPPYSLTSNVSLVSDYYFRGLTQTWGEPAVQGGADFTHGSGLYAGIWGSNVSAKQFAGGTLELDFYGGYNFKLGEDITLGVGGIYYYYPGADTEEAGLPSEKYDTGEVYLSAAWKFLSFKYSYALTDYFAGNANTGFEDDTDGTMYFDLTATVPMEALWGLSLVAHVGYTLYSEDFAVAVNGETDPSYYDWKIGVTKTWEGGWNAGLFYVGATNDFWEDTVSLTSSDTRDLNKDTIILQVGRAF